jgi:hypothetical protein
MKPETEANIEAEMPQFLLYERYGRKGQKLCKCTACGNSGVFEAEGKHKDFTYCPMCMERVQLIAHNRLKNEGKSLERWIPAVWFREHDGALWAAGAKVIRRVERQSYDGPDWVSYLEIIPYEVYCFEPGCAIEYKDSWLYGWETVGRPKEPNTRGYFGQGPSEYYVFQADEIEKSSMKYCAVDEFMVNYSGADVMNDCQELNGVIRYLTAYTERPKLELVVKWGLMDVAKDFVLSRKTNGRTVNWNGNTPWDFLKISKADWNAYRNSDAACVELLQANRKYFHLTIPELLEETKHMGITQGWLGNAELLCSMGLSLKQQRKYIEKQNMTYGYSYASKLIFWIDYIHMAEKLGRDVSITGAIMPRNLQVAHDEMVELQRAMFREKQAMDRKKELEAMERKIKGYPDRRKKLEKKYAYQSGELMIKVPDGAEDIINEGNVLRICVGGYAARHLSGATTILFLRRRRKPNTPYVCVEIDEQTNRIVQIHGYRNEHLENGKRNSSPMKKHGKFIAEWLAWVKAGSKRQNNHREEATA